MDAHRRSKILKDIILQATIFFGLGIAGVYLVRELIERLPKDEEKVRPVATTSVPAVQPTPVPLPPLPALTPGLSSTQIYQRFIKGRVNGPEERVQELSGYPVDWTVKVTKSHLQGDKHFIFMKQDEPGSPKVYSLVQQKKWDTVSGVANGATVRLQGKIGFASSTGIQVTVAKITAAE